MEFWKDLVGYEGIYQISNLGRVKMLDRVVVMNKKGHKRTLKSKILKQETSRGYLNVKLTDSNGIRKTRWVHRLVAETLIKNPLNKEQVNHLDGNKSNNRVENLEWVTRSENVIHAFRTGLNRSTEDSGRKKIPVHQIKNGVIINTFSSMSEAERKTNVNRQEIRKVVRGSRETAKNFEWKLAR